MAVWLLPGQGAQEPGMGAGLSVLPEVAHVFQVASDQLGVDIERLASEAPAEEVNDAFNAQALTMAVTVGLGRELMARGVKPDALVGFSLGQISAVALAGMLPLDQAFALLNVRSKAMAGACRENPGGMLALLGAGVDEAQQLAAQQAQGGSEPQCPRPGSGLGHGCRTGSRAGRLAGCRQALRAPEHGRRVPFAAHGSGSRCGCREMR